MPDAPLRPHVADVGVSRAELLCRLLVLVAEAGCVEQPVRQIEIKSLNPHPLREDDRSSVPCRSPITRDVRRDDEVVDDLRDLARVVANLGIR